MCKGTRVALPNIYSQFRISKVITVFEKYVKCINSPILFAFRISFQDFKFLVENDYEVNTTLLSKISMLNMEYLFIYNCNHTIKIY